MRWLIVGWLKSWAGDTLRIGYDPHCWPAVGMCIVTKSRYDTYHPYIVSIHDMYRWYLFVQNIKTNKFQCWWLVHLSLVFNMCTTLQDSGLLWNSTQSQFGVEWVVFLVKNIKFFSFLAKFKHAEGRTIWYRCSCINDFGYHIIGKYRYFRYIVFR